MKKTSQRIILKWFILIGFFNFYHSYGEGLISAEDMLELQAESHCSANGTLYSTCFGVESSECVEFFKKIFTSCDQLDSSDFFDKYNQSSVSQFIGCAEEEFANHIILKGLDLDAKCQ